MTSPSTLTERVAEMHSMMAGQPLNEVMGAFAREQAGLADGGAPAGVARSGTILSQRGAARRARSGNDALRRGRRRHGGPGLLPGRCRPYCFPQSADEARLLPELTGRGVRLVAGSASTSPTGR
jgi:hypothetical protein